MNLQSVPRLPAAATILIAATATSGCASQPFFDAREQAWLAQQNGALGNVAALHDNHDHAAGDRLWLGHEFTQVRKTLGEPDFAVQVASGGVAFVYYRADQVENSGDQRGECYESYRVNARGRIFSVECI